jgi:signal transduction histidine kinase
LGFSDLLSENLKEFDDATIERYIDIINQTQRKTLDLLNDLLLWSQSQSGKLVPDMQSHNMKNVVADVIAESKSRASKKSIVVNNGIGEELFVSFDLQMLKTILRNLISNAIKFSYKNSEVSVYDEAMEDKVLICVSDSGVGISSDDQKKLFRFGESYSTKGTDDESGTGLGLSLCLEFVKLHKSEIWVESEPRKGSVFKFTAKLALK